MKVVCSYCRKPMGTKEPYADEGVSHGMCEACFNHWTKQWSGVDLEEYLDSFPAPVMVLDAQQRRVVAVNQAAAAILGRPEHTLHGLLSGEAMECVYARLPEGCGRTTHCSTCAIRRAISQAIETRQPVVGVRGRWTSMIGSIPVRVSAHPDGELIRVVLEEAHAEGDES